MRTKKSDEDQQHDDFLSSSSAAMMRAYNLVLCERGGQEQSQLLSTTNISMDAFSAHILLADY